MISPQRKCRRFIRSRIESEIGRSGSGRRSSAGSPGSSVGPDPQRRPPHGRLGVTPLCLLPLSACSLTCAVVVGFEVSSGFGLADVMTGCDREKQVRASEGDAWVSRSASCDRRCSWRQGLPPAPAGRHPEHPLPLRSGPPDQRRQRRLSGRRIRLRDERHRRAQPGRLRQHGR